MITVDEIITKYSLIDQYTANAARILTSTDALRLSIQATTAAVSALTLGLTGALVGGLVALGVHSVQTAMRFDSLRRGLVTVTGSAAEAAAQWERLKKIAELPGLGLEEVVQATIRLQAAGLSGELAEKAISGFGNALASVGGSKEQLEGVILALSQIASKGKLSAEEINQIAERVPQIRKLLVGAFGTADTEAIQKMGITGQQAIEKIVAQLSMLPKATGGAANSFENLQDKIKVSLDKIGRALLRIVVPALEKVANALDKLNNSKAFDDFLKRISGNIVKFVFVVISSLAWMQVVVALVRLAFKDLAGAALSAIAAVALFAVAPIAAGKLGQMLKGLQIGPLPDFPGAPGQGATGNNDPIQQIADNTRRTADNTGKMTDWKQYAFGGGDLGRLGVTPVEMFGGGLRGGRGSMRVRIENAGDLTNVLRAYMEDIANAAVEQSLREVNGR